MNEMLDSISFILHDAVFGIIAVSHRRNRLREFLLV